MKHDLSRQTLGDLLRRTRQRSPNKLAIRCGEVGPTPSSTMSAIGWQAA